LAELEERISALIVARTGTKPERVQLTSRLAQDIGMDGDDAVEFFKKFGEEFHVDLRTLGEHWHQHFAPEGGPSLGFVFVVLGTVILGSLLHRVLLQIPGWAWMIALLGALLWVYNKSFAKPSIPITVQDLVDAAASGKWKLHYEARPESL
jgi:acyl carrier protein